MKKSEESHIMWISTIQHHRADQLGMMYSMSKVHAAKNVQTLLDPPEKSSKLAIQVIPGRRPNHFRLY